MSYYSITNTTRASPIQHKIHVYAQKNAHTSCERLFIGPQYNQRGGNCESHNEGPM